MESLVAFLSKAGPIGIAIVLSSVIALFIIIERCWAFRQLRFKDARLLHRLRKRATEGSYTEAMALVREESHPLAVSMVPVLTRLAGPQRTTRAALEKAIAHGAAREIRQMERFLPTLFLISSVTPLLGLFGTVTGMIKAFQAIQHLGGKVNASVLAGGIWEAMLTTALGLGVAIPAMVAHNYLQGKVHVVVAEIKEESGVLLDELEEAGRLDSTVKAASVHEITQTRREIG
jgi:biopolymer transport protein ExbB